MRRRTTLLLAAIVAMSAMTAAPAAALDGETFAITEVDFENGTITITNHGDADVDPNGLIVCNFPAYAPVAGAPTLEPGASTVIDLAAIGIPADAADGEMGLYLDNDFGNSDSIVSYVEWGSTGHERAPVAQGATVAGETVWDGAAVDGDASALQTQVAFPTSGSDWTAVAAQTDAPTELPFTGVSTTALITFGMLLLGAGTVLVRRSALGTR